jgi:hypothetical protein
MFASLPEETLKAKGLKSGPCAGGLCQEGASRIIEFPSKLKVRVLQHPPERLEVALREKGRHSIEDYFESITCNKEYIMYALNFANLPPF